MRFFHIQSDQFSELDELPAQLPDTGYLWIGSARREFEAAIALDPAYAQAHACLAWTHWLNCSTINCYDAGQERLAFEQAERSLELQEKSLAHRALAKRDLRTRTF